MNCKILNTTFFSKAFIVLLFIVFNSSVSTHAQGPSSPEAAGFEPVDASDMVSLVTGDLSYVLPIMDVDGFPVSLSYHAGITGDMQSSWVGLGWYLTPGAINRTVTNTPDDWKSGVGIDFTSYENSETYYGVTVDFGFEGAATVGVGLNWGGGKGMSGTLRAGLGFDASKYGLNGGYGGSASVSTTGNVSVGLNAGVGVGSFGAGASIGYSTGGGFNAGIGVGTKVGSNGFVGIGASLSEGGNFSIGASGGQSKVFNNISGERSASGGGGFSSSSFSSGDFSMTQQGFAFAVPLHIIGVPITLGFSKQKVEYKLRKGFLSQEWGALYGSDHTNLRDGVSTGLIDGNYGDYQNRLKSFDVYSTQLPQPIDGFIADRSQDIQKVNFTFMGYDDYAVNAPGIGGSITPRLFQNTAIFGKGTRSQNELGDDIHLFWHNGNNGYIQRTFGTDFPAASNQEDDLYFYFNNQYTSNEIIVPSTVDNINATSVGGHLTYPAQNQISQRAHSSSYIEVFTNRQIASGYAANRGLITPSNEIDAFRNFPYFYDPDGIGAYKITSTDGKTYHFSLPVYQYERVQRSLIEDDEAPWSPGFASNVKEKRQYSRYATHWLLTGITGSDYIDLGTQNKIDDEDYGYWVELEYGNWSDGYVWRTPHENGVKEYNTNLVNQVEEKDKGYYQFGRKQLYYLDKIKTKEKTALFIKDIRYDAVGKELNYGLTGGYKADGTINTTGGNGGLNQTGNVFIREGGVSYAREYTLKLDKIILLQTDIANTLSKNNETSSLGQGLANYEKNSTHDPNWESPDFLGEYTFGIEGETGLYRIHSENRVFDVNDVNNAFIQEHALKVVEFDHDYSLAKKSPSSLELPSSLTAGKQGKLTLNKIHFKGRGGASYMPPYSFDYALKNMKNISFADIKNQIGNQGNADQLFMEAQRNAVDGWGFLKGTYAGENKAMAWSLNEVKTPTGAVIQIDYEEDDYWTEAFGRRFWDNSQLQFRFVQEIDGANVQQFLDFRPRPDDITASDINMLDYFNVGDMVFADAVHDRNPPGSDNRRFAYASGSFEVLFVSSNLLRLKLPDEETHLDTPRGEDNCDESPYFGHYRYNQLGGWEAYFLGDGASLCNINGGSDGGNRTITRFKIIASRVPLDETGGGLRVAEIKTIDPSNNATYKITYDYNFPFLHQQAGSSSGITSFAPVKGLKFVPYQSEIPGPGVTYEYVTVRERDASNNYDVETRYRHHVLKPIRNIFDPNIELLAQDHEAQEDRIFWATVEEDIGGLDGNNSRKAEGKAINVHINSALIGQLKSVEVLNRQGHILQKTENEYINGEFLTNTEPNKGYVRESFTSLKSIIKTDQDGANPETLKNLLSISTKTEYNNMLKRVRSYTGNQENIVTYANVDPWLGSFRESITELADGTLKKDTRIPAYEKYPELGSKVLLRDNKNMLNQEAVSLSQISINGGASWKTVNASISTWNDDWIYRDAFGIESSGTIPVWRKHKSFVWKDAIDNDGAYATNVNGTSDYFTWGSGIPTSNKWQNVSEITKYNYYSIPLETRDINNNYAGSRMSADESKVLVTGNARMTEMYASSAERVLDDNQFEGEVYGANFRVSDRVHAGSYAVMNNSANDRVFEIKNTSSQASGNIRPDTYKVSYWHTVQDNNKFNILKYNNTTIEASESVTFGCWVLKNYYINYYGGAFNLYVTNTFEGGHYFDDFRVHPIASSISSYVYNDATDDLLFVLDGNNLASAFKYDNAGRLIKTYSEVPSSDPFIGGYKVQGKNGYKYATTGASVDIYPDNINWYDCLDNIPPDDPSCPELDDPNAVDTDGDGLPDACDSDDDNDGIEDNDDPCPLTPNSTADNDNDGIPDDCDPDDDNDGIPDEIDNCQFDANTNQNDADNDGVGDVCDEVIFGDTDGDGIEDNVDNCVFIYNPGQEDFDGDGIGDVCDNCPSISNANQNDADNDGVGDVCDNCLNVYNSTQVDADNDGLGDECDPNNSCDPNDPTFVDSDGDGIGDACDDTDECGTIDSDGDGIGDDCDPCPLDPDPSCGFSEDCGTLDSDGDGTGDGCDTCPYDPDPNCTIDCGLYDEDGDGIGNSCDNCVKVANPNQSDIDSDGIGDVCDNCIDIANGNQIDSNGNGIGDACEEDCTTGPDADGDGVNNTCDNCLKTYNPDQADQDGDGIGDACDNCVGTQNTDQIDCDGDGIGDVCDPEIDCNYSNLKLKSLKKICDAPFDPEYKATVVGGSGERKYEWRWLIDEASNTYSPYVIGTYTQLIPYVIRIGSSNQYSVKYYKEWKLEVKVTDLITGEIVTGNAELDENILNNYQFNSQENNDFHRLEISKCHDDCGDSAYNFHIYSADPNLSTQLKYEYAFYDKNTDSWSDYIDVTSTNGSFCPSTYYVNFTSCSSNYLLYAPITFKITDLLTGEVSGEEADYYGVYLDCANTPIDNSQVITIDNIEQGDIGLTKIIQRDGIGGGIISIKSFDD